MNSNYEEVRRALDRLRFIGKALEFWSDPMTEEEVQVLAGIVSDETSKIDTSMTIESWDALVGYKKVENE